MKSFLALTAALDKVKELCPETETRPRKNGLTWILQRRSD